MARFRVLMVNTCWFWPLAGFCLPDLVAAPWIILMCWVSTVHSQHFVPADMCWIYMCIHIYISIYTSSHIYMFIYTSSHVYICVYILPVWRIYIWIWKSIHIYKLYVYFQPAKVLVRLIIVILLSWWKKAWNFVVNFSGSQRENGASLMVGNIVQSYCK